MNRKKQRLINYLRKRPLNINRKEENEIRVLNQALNKINENNQKNYLNDIRERYKNELNKIRNDLTISLQNSMLLPPADTKLITYPSGKKEIVTDEIISHMLKLPMDQKREYENKIKELEFKINNTPPQDVDRIYALTRELEQARDIIERNLESSKQFIENNFMNNFSNLEGYFTRDPIMKNRLIHKLGFNHTYQNKPLTEIFQDAGKQGKLLLKDIEDKLKYSKPILLRDRGTKLELDWVENIIGKGLPLEFKVIDNFRKDDALTNFQIEEYMRKMRKKGFLGVYMADEIDDIDEDKLKKRGSLIFNIDPNETDGKQNQGTHWVALFWNIRHENEGDYKVHFEKNNNRGVFYFDSFGRPPSKKVKKNIKKLVDKLINKYDIDYQIYFDYNERQYQNLQSWECGFYSMSWIIDMYNGYPFDECAERLKEEVKLNKQIKNDLRNNIEKIKKEIL